MSLTGFSEWDLNAIAAAPIAEDSAVLPAADAPTDGKHKI